MAEKIVRKDWISQFTLIGKPVITDFTFEIDKQSEKSSYVYNRMRLGIDCGEKHGTVWVSLMGGYPSDSPYMLYKPTKKEDGSADFENKMQIDWEDRLNDEVVEQVADMALFTVGLKKTAAGKTYYQNFISEYDAIAYIKENLTSDMVVNVKGNLQYSKYNGSVKVDKNVTSIVLSAKEDPADFKAAFTQSILLDKDSATLTPDNIDKDKGVMFVNARVLDYIKEYNGVTVRGQFPYNVQFEQAMQFDNQELCKKMYDLVYKIKKGITQVTMEGEFIESGATVKATWDDVPEAIKDLVTCGFYTEEEALARCSSNGSTERRMVLKRPMIKLVGEDKIPTVHKFESRYEDEDLILDCMMNNVNDNDSSEDSDLDWLADLA